MDKANSDARQNIRVFVRVRPSLAIESSSRSVLECTSDSEITVKDNNKGKISDRTTKTFRFNQVFSPQASQVEVYQHVVEPLLEEVLQGYSCTVFAYGQTGTGKTFTMEGERSSDLSWSSDPKAGIIPRTLSELFDRLRLAEVNYAVRISFLELYNEELIDLLSAPEDTTRLRLFEDATKKGSVIISGLEEVEVCTKADVYKILEKGSLKRQTASTLMNAHSSRSHTVFTATLYIRERAENADGQDVVRTGKINLVDLAGSENIGRSGAIDKRAREAGNINQSLLTLGRVITALVEQSPHIPYRESKLTRLLQESLGGRTKTSIIATVSPALCNYEETLSTLEYAHRAKNIQNKPEVNQRFSKKLHLTEYTEEIERLHRDLEATRQRTGVFLDQGEYDDLLRRLELLAEECNEKMEEIKALNEERQKQEALCNELLGKLEVVDADLQQNEAALEAENSRLVELQSNVEKTRLEEREQTHLVAKHWETGQKLKSQATELKAVAELSSKKSVLLHDKLDRVRSVTKTNESLGVEMQTKVSEKIESALSLIGNAAEEDTAEVSGIRSQLNSVLNTVKGHVKEQEAAERVHREKQAEIIEKCRRSAKEQAQQEVDWAAQLLERVIQRSNSARSVESWQCDVAQPILMKQHEQMEECSSDIANLLQKTKKGDAWQHENRLAHADIITKQCAALVEVHVPALGNELQEIDKVETILAEWKKEHGVFNQEVREDLAEVVKLLRGVQAKSKKWQETSQARRADIAKVVDKFAEGAASLKQSVEKFVAEGNAELAQTKEHFTQRVLNVCQETFTAVDEMDASDQLGDLPSSTRKVLEEAREAWKVQNEDTTLQINEQNAQRSNTTESFNNCIKEAESLMTEFVSGNSNGLDEISSNLSDGTADVELRRVKYNENVKTWTSSLDEIISECKERVHDFVHEDFQQCVSTGETPARGDISYPRDLPATSPHERIIGRFRERMRLAKLSAEEEHSDSQKDSLSDRQSDSSSANSLVAVDSLTEIDKGVRNKENSDSIRESPLKKPDERKPRSRKPLVSHNGVRQ